MRDINGQEYSTLQELQQHCLNEQFPFVSYQRPGSKQLLTIIQRNSDLNIITDYSDINDQKGFIFAPFQISKNAPCFLISPDIVLEGRKINMDKIPSSNKKKIFITNNNTECFSTTKEQYILTVKKAIEAIKTSNLNKVIVSRIQSGKVDYSFNPFDVFTYLCDNNDNAFVYVAFHPDFGIWMGATPELLIEVNESDVNVVAMAGTQRKGTKDIQNIQWKDKEIEEHKVVSDYIYNCLKSNNLTNINYPKPISFDTGHVIHIKTNFTAKKNDGFKLGKIIAELHPTPSISGYPKMESLEFIYKHEDHQRDYYCGLLGPLNMNNTSNLFVNLRCMRIYDNSLVLYVGAGITIDSNPEAEWQETVDKSQTLLSTVDLYVKIDN